MIKSKTEGAFGFYCRLNALQDIIDDFDEFKQ